MLNSTVFHGKLETVNIGFQRCFVCGFALVKENWNSYSGQYANDQNDNKELYQSKAGFSAFYLTSHVEHVVPLVKFDLIPEFISGGLDFLVFWPFIRALMPSKDD